AESLATGPTFAHMMTKTMLNQEWSMTLTRRSKPKRRLKRSACRRKISSAHTTRSSPGRSLGFQATETRRQRQEPQRTQRAQRNPWKKLRTNNSRKCRNHENLEAKGRGHDLVSLFALRANVQDEAARLNALTEQIIAAAIAVHRTLGPGL